MAETIKSLAGLAVVLAVLLAWTLTASGAAGPVAEWAALVFGAIAIATAPARTRWSR